MNNRFSIREIECFVAVGEQLSFARAAQRIHLSQPPITRHIQQLENRLGTVLLKRSTHHVELTPTGVLFLRDAREILRLVDRAAGTARRAENGQTDRLNIGFVGALLEGEMTETLRSFRDQRGNCQIRLQDMLSPDLIDSVTNKKIDGAFIGATPAHLNPALCAMFWKRERFKIALPKRHPMAELPELDLRDLANEDWIALQEKSSPALYQHMLYLCTQAGFHPTVVEESDRWTAIIAMVSLGEGICLIPESATKIDARIDESSAIFKPLIQPNAVLERSFLYSKGNVSPLLSELVEFISQSQKSRQGD